MKSKVIMKIAIIVIIPLLFVFFMNRIIQTANLKKKNAETISILQPFTAYKNNKAVLIDQSKITKDFLLLAFVSTDCEHCDYMTEELKKHIREFEKFNIVMLAMGTEQSLHLFTAKHNLSLVNDITLLWDKDFKIKKQFAVSSTPEFFIYNKAGQSMLHIKGETKIENLLKAIETNEED